MIIVDANIIFSVAIKPSGIVGSVFYSNTKFSLVAPEYLKDEINDHKYKLISITKKSEEEIDFVLSSVFKRITFYQVGIVSANIIEKAKEIVADIDPNDFAYIAFALFFNTKVWSGDKELSEGLKAKGLDLTLTTQDVAIAIMK